MFQIIETFDDMKKQKKNIVISNAMIYKHLYVNVKLQHSPGLNRTFWGLINPSITGL